MAERISSAVLRKAWSLLGDLHCARNVKDLFDMFEERSQCILPHESFLHCSHAGMNYQGEPSVPLYNTIPNGKNMWEAYSTIYYQLDPLNDLRFTRPYFNVPVAYPPDIHKTEFFNEYAAQFELADSLGCQLLVGGKLRPTAVLRLKGSPRFNNHHLEVSNLLAPHLAYSLEMCEMMERSAKEQAYSTTGQIGLLEPCQSPMWKIGLDFSVQWANGAAESLMQSWGEERRTIKGKCLFDSFPRDIQGLLWSVRNIWMSLQRGAVTPDAPSRRIRMDVEGRTFVFNATILPPVNSEGASIIMTVEAVSPIAASRPDINSFGLTMREKEIAALVAEGLSNGGICDKVSLSLDTVKQHVSSILRKTESKNRSAAVKKLYMGGKKS